MDPLCKIYNVDKKEAEHVFKELMIGINGQLSHFIDYKEHPQGVSFITFVTKGKISYAVRSIKNIYTTKYQKEWKI
ncbi:hypothetical protein [Sphingobacterium paucimobilis]|uniref:Uncharacterized protein n=1 Tax=Sphingobacterium paucimobilis HER1398 TaxID=1346330 RepID=U2IZJ5_9SPHI|nr:hypothetical protein [Sphingobacterium paucimobilis]ERJ58094.1 hypothetical protein M472_04880 [Sphingobacterium paucimobilis HER1398]